MTNCRLCQDDCELRNSHIVSEFLYGELYNDKHQIMGIDGAGNRGWKTLQKGVREPLLCESCEQLINEKYEKPFRKLWVEEQPLPDPWNVNGVHWVTFDYTNFKLFHLSVLFRASVSSLPTFAAVSLGPHEEIIRNLLINADPGTHSQYPIFGHAVVHHKTNALVQIVSQAEQSGFRGHHCYAMMYGGVQWWWSVSSHRNREFELISLQEDGRMPFQATPWNEIGIIQSAAEALRRGKI